MATDPIQRCHLRNQTEALRESRAPLGEKATFRVKRSSRDVETKIKTLQKELREQQNGFPAT